MASDAPNTLALTVVDNFIVRNSCQESDSESVGVALTRADADCLLNGGDEDLAVADLAGLGGRRDGVDDFAHEIGGDSHFDLQLGKEAHRVFGAAVNLG